MNFYTPELYLEYSQIVLNMHLISKNFKTLKIIKIFKSLDITYTSVIA